MKRIILVISLLVISYYVISQEIVLTFNPVEPTLTIDSINATNIKSGESITVTGSNTILLDQIATAYKTVNRNSENLLFYPNPFYGKASLNYTSSVDDNIDILLINSVGQILDKISQDIKPGLHRFNVSVINEGIYMVSIIGKEGVFTNKSISLSGSENGNQINYKALAGEELIKKSSIIESHAIIHFLIYSGDNITKIVDSPVESKTYDVEIIECKDEDGKNYPVVQIGDQWWMAENLAYGISGGSWAYNNDESNVATSGRLYAWEVAKTACPNGWHLPGDDEWKQMETAIGLNQNEINDTGWRGTDEGTKLKTNSGWGNNKNGSDDFGFSGFPGGYHYGGNFNSMGYYGYWWSSSEFTTSSVWFRQLYYNTTNLYRGSTSKTYGFSVRCVKN